MKKRYGFLLVMLVASMMCAATLFARQTSTHGKHVPLHHRHRQHLLLPSQKGSHSMARKAQSTRPGHRSPAVDVNCTFLDNSYGTKGIATTAFASTDGALSAAIQSNGKIVTAGESNGDFALVRYDTLGVPDGTFGSGGTMITDFGSEAEARSVAIQLDGKIVAAGYSGGDGSTVFTLARYDTAGNPDSTFGTNGKDTTAIGAGGDDEAYSVAIQSDGKIVVAGYSNDGHHNDFAVARYTANGTLDVTFGAGGKVTTAVGSGGDDRAYAVAIQGDGKIVVAGYSYDGSSNNDFFALVRYDAAGNLDGTFGTGGKVTTAFGSGGEEDDAAYSIAIQSDGKIVVAGYSTDPDDFALARYNTIGTLDTTFGAGGKVTTAIGSGSAEAYSDAIQSDGKIVVAGYSNDGSNDDFAVARYDTCGNLDGTFGTGGKVTTAVGVNDADAYSAVIQRDGKIVAAGYSSDGSNDDFTLVRYITYPVGFGAESASNITDSSATLNGSVNAEGVTTIVRFLYGSSSGSYSDSAAADQSPLTADTGVAVSAVVKGCTPGGTYYYRISTSSSKGYFRADEKSFRTLIPKPGTALKFDGTDDYVKIEDNSQLELTTNYTIEAWIKPHGFGWLYGIVSKYQTSGSNGYFLRLSNSSPYTGISFDGMQTGNGILEADNWYHIAAVNNGGTRLLYINGSNVPLNGTPIDVQVNSDPLTIGVDFLVENDRYFNGIIDEVRIFNVALDSTQIREDMHRVFASTPAGLIGYWQFNDSTGTSAQEVVNGFDGTLTNFEFDASDGWVSSTIPAGKGTSTDSTNFTDGTATLGTLSLVTTDAFDNPMQLVATQIDGSPNSLPNSSPTMLSDRYWVINVFGTPGTFSTNLTFTVPTSFTSNGSLSPLSFTLYRRSSTSDGDWTMLINGASNVTSTTVTFDGITSFSQFSLGQGALLPIQIAAFTANVGASGVKLDWTTISETNNYGFFVERHRQDSTVFKTVSALISGAGTSLSQHHYSWIDSSVAAGNYIYRLRQVDMNGAVSYSQPITVNVVMGVNDDAAPRKFQLLQSYPNPFNPTAKIKFSVEHAEHATLIVYDILGQEVVRLFDAVAEPGHYYSFDFDGTQLSSGVYVYRIVTDSRTDVKKMLMLK